MKSENSEPNEPARNMEIVKEENNPNRSYIFQKSGITKTGFWIIIGFLVLIVVGLIISGVFFGDTETSP